MDSVIESIEQVTPKWLSHALRESGYLQQGEVEALRKDPSYLEGFTSERYHLELIYTKNTPKSAPDHLFIKIGKSEFFETCKKEIEFYKLSKKAQIAPSFIRCFHSGYSSETKQSHLLFQDLSKTHYNPDFTGFRRDSETPIPLTHLECEGVIECLATVHAFWWNNPQLGNEIEFSSTKESSAQLSSYLEECMVSIFDALGERLSPKRRSLYESVLSSYPDLYWNYIDEGAPLTIIHGDAHLGNFMFPIDPGKDNTILLDWQSWRVDIGIEDLAHLMALNWHPNQRQEMERDLLVYYHNQLSDKGVTNYSWDDCWLGYRITAIWMLFIPIIWFSLNLPLDHCWPFMEKSYAAFKDLQCIELLNC